MREYPFSPEMMEAFVRGAADIAGRPVEGNNNTEEIEAMKEALYLALDELTDRQMECIEMYFWGEMTQQEIADDLGIGQSRVAQHISAGIKKLRGSKKFVKVCQKVEK